MNENLLRRTLERVQAEAAKPPDECRWYQGAWASARDCGTAYCFAGWALSLSGFEAQEAVVGCGPEWPDFDPATTAMDLLGIDPNQAEYLFNPLRTLGDLEYGVERILADPFWDPFEAVGAGSAEW